MSTLRSFARPLALALAFVFTAAPLVASAGTKEPAPTEEHGKKGHKFPVDADKFQKHVDKRIEHAKKKLEHILAEHNVPDALKQQIRKDFDDSAAAVRAAAAKAGQDGKVTREEADQVRDLAKDLLHKAREKYGKLVRGEGKAEKKS
jgi:hypothetical protein